MEVGSQTDWDLHHKKKEAFSELNQQRFSALFCANLPPLGTPQKKPKYKESLCEKNI